jgi:cyclophilin family peptidyl-prolyl cis-trans isomerase
MNSEAIPEFVALPSVTPARSTPTPAGSVMKRPLMSAPLPFSTPTGSRQSQKQERKPKAKLAAVPARRSASAGTAPNSSKPTISKAKVRASSTSRQQRRERIIENLETRQVFAAPTLGPIVDQSLLSGAPLQIALQGADADGDALTFSVTSDNPNIVAEMRATTNRYLVLNISHTSSGQAGDSDFSGQLIFQLFEDLTPEVTNRIITLVNQGFYNNLIFHRIINNFVIQGGDPLGDGTGGSGVQFDDVFNPDLQHTVSGLLSMAKSSDDTNDSQFFITEGPQRNLDFNHSIFGMLVSGESLREMISNVPTASGDKPFSDVTITSATIETYTNYEVLTVKAANGYTGSGTITVTVDDGNGGTTQQTFTVNATPDTVDNDPYLINPPQQINLTANGAAVQYQIQANNIDGGTTTYNAYLADPADSAKVTLTINKSTGLLTVTPKNGFVGVVNIVIMTSPLSVADHEFIEQQAAASNVTIQVAYDFYARNNGIKFDTQSVPVVVNPTTPLTIDLQDTSDTGSSSTDNITNKNNNGNSAALTFVVSGTTPGAIVQLFDGTTLIGQATATGTSVEITTDGTTLLNNGQRTITAHQQFTIDAGNQQRLADLPSALDATMTVIVDSSIPVFTSQPVTSLVQFSLYNYNADTDDEFSNGATYNLLNAPQGMVIDPATGQVAWMPDQNQINAGFADVTIQATDKAGNVSVQNFTITFVPNEAPTLDAIPTQAVDENTTFSYALVAQDQNLPGDTLTYSLISGPAGATINPTTGVVTFTPAESDGGTTKTFTVRVTDAGDKFAERTFELVVNDTNSNPIVTPVGTQTVTENQQLVVQINAYDNDLSPAPGNQFDTLSYELLGGPPGTSIDANGVITWTPDEAFGGTQQLITFRVNDSAGGSTTVSFAVNVVEQNINPILSVQTTHTIDELQTLTFTASASDADAPAQALFFSLNNAPSGMTINTQTGVITWTPTEAQGPGTFVIQVRVNDSLGGFDTELVTITVNETNQAPILNALNTLEAFSGGTLTAQIPGFDPDLPTQGLVYTLEAGPDGLIINASTGVITWSLPESATAGIASITVRLTDAAGASVTRDYQIQVSQFNPGRAFGLVSQWTSTSVPTQQDTQPLNLLVTPQTVATVLVSGQVAPVSVLGSNTANSVTALLGGLNRLQGADEPQVVAALKPVIEGGAEGAINESKSSTDKPESKPDSNDNPFNSSSTPATDPATPANTVPTGLDNPQSRRQRQLDWREQLRSAALVETALADNTDLNWVRRAPQAPVTITPAVSSAPAPQAVANVNVELPSKPAAESEPLAASVGVLAAASLVLRPRQKSAPVAIPVVNDEVRRKRGPRRNWY